VTILDQPQKVIKLGVKKIDVYPNIKLIFINGQLRDIQ